MDKKLVQERHWNQYKQKVDQSSNNPKLSFEIFITLMLLYINNGYVFCCFTSETNEQPMMRLLRNLGLISLKDSNHEHACDYDLCSLTKLGLSYIESMHMISDFRKILPDDNIPTTFKYNLENMSPGIIPLVFSVIIVICSGIMLNIPIWIIVAGAFALSLVTVPFMTFGSKLEFESSVLSTLHTQNDFLFNDNELDRARKVFKQDHTQDLSKRSFVDFMDQSESFRQLIINDTFNQIINSINYGYFCYDKKHPDPLSAPVAYL